MKKLPTRFTIKTMLVAFFFVSYILAAYCRGNQLLGVSAGITYAVVATFFALLFVRQLSQTPLSRWNICLLAAFAVPVSLAFVFPAYVNSDVQYFVNKQAVDRNARGELAELFAADPAFQDLTITTKHLKVVNVHIRGSVPTKPDLERLRLRVLGKCDFVEKCFVHWHIHVREESRTYTGMDDRDLTTLQFDTFEVCWMGGSVGV